MNKTLLYEVANKKRVVIVGPSPHLVGKGLGEEINKYDIVCRVNDYYPHNQEQDYGNRTDIVFDSCDTRVLKDMREKIIRDKEKIKKVKLVVCPCMIAHHGDNGSGVENNFKVNNICNLRFWKIDKQIYKEINGEVGVELNSGMAALQLLIRCDLRELFITGFSFYLQWKERDNYDAVYKKGHHENPQNYFKNTWNPFLSHPQIPQINFFKKILLKKYSNVIKIDSYLRNLLNIEYSKVYDL